MKFLCALFFVSVFSSILCANVIDLNGQWEVLNNNKGYRIPATVPGSIYTALIENKIIGDPYYRDNDVQYRWIAHENWTYTRTFEVLPEILSKSSLLLVAEGLDTFATVNVNGVNVGETENMFVRYVLDIKDALKSGTNNITIEFTSALLVSELLYNQSKPQTPVPNACPQSVQNGECYRNFIRKEQCSFSWDWGPAFPGQGIWKNISIDAFDSAVIRVLTALPKLDGDVWSIDIKIDFDLDKEETGNLTTTLEFESSTSGEALRQTTPLSTVPSSYTYNFQIPKDFSIHLWWPNGYGEQALYDLKVMFTNGNEESERKVRIGFRTIELVQTPVSNNASQGLSFYFKINSVPVFFKGTNWIPADSFQERITKERLKTLLGSAAEVHINSMRVWGGGVYESEDFYDLTDELGIMIWQDLMYSDALYPVTPNFLYNVMVEVKQQVSRLKTHASVALWSGNNENEGIVSSKSESLKEDYVKLYIDTIMPIVEQEDNTRPFLPSSPTNGPETQKQGWIAKNPRSEFYGDDHYYNYLDDLWDWRTFPIPRFTSEFGSEAWCNFETIEKVFNDTDFDYNSAMSYHRQHHPMGNTEMLNQTNQHISLATNANKKQLFKDLIYIIQIHQAMAIRTETEHYRRFTNELMDDGRGLTMGALYWQLNDIWQAPTWASIDYDANWKMLHYYARKFFDSNLISPFIEGENLNIYMVIDEIPNYQDVAATDNNQIQFKPVKSLRTMMNSRYPKDRIIKQLHKAAKASSGQVIMELYTWKTMLPLKSWSIPFVLNKTSGLIYKKKLDDVLSEGGCTDKKNCFLYFYLNSKINPTSTSWLPLTYFTQTANVIPKADILVSNVVAHSNVEFIVTLTTDNIAPFVWINAYNIPGRFSDNGFVMKDPILQLTFTSWQPVDLDTFKQSLTVKSLMDIY